MSALKRTKILATLGPASDDPGVLEGILRAGVNVVRINFSHGDRKTHLRRVRAVREYAAKNNVCIGVLMDLQGPKIRIASFSKTTAVVLNVGDIFTLDADMDEKKGTHKMVGTTYKTLPEEVKIDDTLLLDDGRVALNVVRIDGKKIVCRVVQGGELSSNKGINLKGGGLSTKALTRKDKDDIRIAAEAEADFVALSFPSGGDDIRETKKLLKQSGSSAAVVAKIERAEALEDKVLGEIIRESDGIMVARGDLGVEIGDPLLPAQQKRLIALARQNDRFVITATQMMDSMIKSPIPTRAEVFDVANAVLDGTDAVMLSAETAVGDFPKRAVETMNAICLETEKNPIAKTSHHRLHERFEYIDETIAMSTMYAANHLGAKAIAALTQTGKTVLWMSRISSNTPIFAMSDNAETLRKTTIYRGVYQCVIQKGNPDEWARVNQSVVSALKKNLAVRDKDLVILTKGMHRDKSGGTNLMKIVRVGDSDY